MATATVIAYPTRTRSRRPSRGAARQVRPSAQPRTAVPGPRVRVLEPAVARSCRISPVAPVRDLDYNWRLTRRGMTVIMVIGLAIAAAALTVIGATVARVTADDYRPAEQSALR